MILNSNSPGIGVWLIGAAGGREGEKKWHRLAAMEMIWGERKKNVLLFEARILSRGYCTNHYPLSFFSSSHPETVTRTIWIASQNIFLPPKKESDDVESFVSVLGPFPTLTGNNRPIYDDNYWINKKKTWRLAFADGLVKHFHQLLWVFSIFSRLWCKITRTKKIKIKHDIFDPNKKFSARKKRRGGGEGKRGEGEGGIRRVNLPFKWSPLDDFFRHFFLALMKQFLRESIEFNSNLSMGHSTPQAISSRKSEEKKIPRKREGNRKG